MSDFDELPEDFDPSAHKDGFEPIPVDWYMTQVIQVEVRRTKDGKGTYLYVVFEVLDGDHRGRRIFQNITLQNRSQQAIEIGAKLLKGLYEAVGHTGPTRKIEILLNRPVMARVGIERDNNGVYDDKNCVTRVKPPDYQPPKRTAGAVPSNTTPPVTPKGPASPPTPVAASAKSGGGSAPWRS